MHEVLNDIQRRLRAGSSFGDAIAMHTKVFPGYYIAVVRAAELTGHLDDALDQLAAYLERDIDRPPAGQELAHVPVDRLRARDRRGRSSWRSFVLPKFKDFYTSLDADLPLPTRMLLGFTDFIADVVAGHRSACSPSRSWLGVARARRRRTARPAATRCCSSCRRSASSST